MIEIISFLSFISACAATFCSSNPDTLTIYPSPNNCSTFKACIHNEESEFDCIQAPLFIPFSSETICMTPCAAVSKAKKAPSASSSEWPEDKLLFPDSPARTIVCPPTGETVAVVVQSCDEYLICKGGVGTRTKCPEGQEFSPSRYECVVKRNSDCRKQKLKGSHHIKCRFDKGTDPILFSSDVCPRFKKCANQLSWEIECARYTHWNNEMQSCEWADKFDCHLTNH
jgi:Chitin binding Peritrophin-A domain